jgi:hypothetical protein
MNELNSLLDRLWELEQHPTPTFQTIQEQWEVVQALGHILCPDIQKRLDSLRTRIMCSREKMPRKQVRFTLAKVKADRPVSSWRDLEFTPEIQLIKSVEFVPAYVTYKTAKHLDNLLEAQRTVIEIQLRKATR